MAYLLHISYVIYPNSSPCYPDQLDQIVLGESRQIGYVYFLQEKKYGSVKIGRSLNLDLRLSNWIELCLQFNPLAKASEKKKSEE